MLSVLAIFIVIFFISTNLGRTINQILLRDKYKIYGTVDMDIVSGICLCSLYAQIVSLIGGVGREAFIVIAFLSLILFYVNRASNYYRNFFNGFINLDIKSKITIFIMLFGVILWSTISPQHYDTYLYHAQAIHWIEDFGVVPGLGNLHFRLAYNSALMPLHALFSFKWISGQSFHVVNGFFTVFICIYVFNKFIDKKEYAISLSDLLGLGAVFYVLYDCSHVSSPNSDTITLLLVYYVLIKWADYSEKRYFEVDVYAYLCTILVYLMTFKLSAGILIILTVFPAIELLKGKKYKKIVGYIGYGIIVLIPFIVRNILISGYLLYPYEKTGIKELEWRVPETTLRQDLAEIIAWGRGNCDVSRNGEYFWQWIPQWFENINILWRIMFILCIISMVYILVYMISRGKEKIKTSYGMLVISCILGWFFWLFSAPLPRYGTVYMISLPFIAIDMALADFKGRSWNKKIKLMLCSAGRNAYWLLGLLYIVVFWGYVAIFNGEFPDLVVQGDYYNKDTYSVSDSGVEIAVPITGDQTGYEPFPSTPYVGSAQNIILRGEDVEDGFKTRY